MAQLGLKSVRPQTSAGGTKPNAPLYHTWHQTVQTLHSPARNAATQWSRQNVQASHAWKGTGRYLLPQQDEENIVTIDGLSDVDAASCTKTRRSTYGGTLRVGRHTLATWSSKQKVVSLSSAESAYYSMVRCASEAIGLAHTVAGTRGSHTIARFSRTGPPDHRTTGPPDHRTTRPPDHRTTGLPDHRTPDTGCT